MRQSPNGDAGLGHHHQTALVAGGARQGIELFPRHRIERVMDPHDDMRRRPQLAEAVGRQRRNFGERLARDQGRRELARHRHRDLDGLAFEPGLDRRRAPDGPGRAPPRSAPWRRRCGARPRSQPRLWPRHSRGGGPRSRFRQVSLRARRASSSARPAHACRRRIDVERMSALSNGTSLPIAAGCVRVAGSSVHQLFFAAGFRDHDLALGGEILGQIDQ